VVDILQDFGVEVSVANPLKNKLIGTSRKKTDMEDARKLANLLRTGYLPTVYIPSKEERDLKKMAREKASLVQHRTRLKSQTRSMLLQDGITVNKPWSKEGRVKLEEIGDERVQRRIRILDVVDEEIKDAMQDIEVKVKITENAELLMSAPGIGRYAAMLILGEVGDVKRFPSSKKFTAYSGLVPGVRQLPR
jgi:transposase